MTGPSNLSTPGSADRSETGWARLCLVGAGPRGLSVLERLCAREAVERRWNRVTVHVVDPFPPGAGQVWRTSQSHHLLMNTVACQITVYTDPSVRMTGPLDEGPSLYQWAQALACRAITESPAGVRYDDQTLAEARDLGPDTYPTRAFYGHYLTWAFQRVTRGATAHVSVSVHRSRAIALAAEGRDKGGPQTVLLEDGTHLTGLAAVVLAQGHLPVEPSAGERGLTAFADRGRLGYVPPANPADVDLSAIRPGEPVLLRGLGLNFFDHMALFTLGRGGTFVREGDRLVYVPSGREPRMYAGSRRGIPYHARGDNEKGAFGRHTPRLLTQEVIEGFRERTRRGAPVRFVEELWPLIAREVEGVYYTALLAARARNGAGGQQPLDTEEFARRHAAAAPGAEQDALLAEFGIGEDERWDWARIERPYGEREFAGPDDFRQWLLGHLREDVREARAGNVRGPLKAALDVLRDLRNEIRQVVDHAGLDAASHRDELDGWYTPLNAFLSIGPPTTRIEQLIALVEAGVLDVIGPGMRIDTDTETGGGEGGEGRAADGGPCFTATSARVPGTEVRARVLIEARLPDTDLRRTQDPLLAHLMRTGQCAAYRIPGADGSHVTGGLHVTERPYHLVDANGVPHPRRFAYGVPTESVHWVTAAGIRPGVGSVTLEDSDAIAEAVLALSPLPEEPPAYAMWGLEELMGFGFDLPEVSP